MIIINEDSSSNWEIIIESCCIMESSSTQIDAQRFQPVGFSLPQSANRLILAVKFAKDFRDASFYLSFWFFSHQWSEWHWMEISSQADAEVVYSRDFMFHFIYIIFKGVIGKIFKFVTVSEVKATV